MGVGKDVLSFRSAPSFKQNDSVGTAWIVKHLSFHFGSVLILRAAPENFSKSNQYNYISKFLL